MDLITCQIYKDRKIIFTETFDNSDNETSYLYRDYYFGKARYEGADKIVFKLSKKKSLPLGGDLAGIILEEKELPF